MTKNTSSTKKSKHQEVEGESVAPLPSLYSNNSIETPQPGQELDVLNHVIAIAAVLSPYHKKRAESLAKNVMRFVEKEAISPNHVGFLTLTFPDNVTAYKEASRRFNSLNTNFLSPHPEIIHWTLVAEQQKRGAWHFHLLLALSQDIKTGVNFEEIEKGVYRSASPYLRGIWKDLREAMPKYNFGRSELMPVRSNAEAMGRYIGKYISKHMGHRSEDSKGARLVRYSQGWPRNSMKFSWNTQNAKQWREKLNVFAKLHGCTEFYQLSEKLGNDWAYIHAQEIFDIESIQVLFEKIEPMAVKEYESPELARVYRNFESAEKEIEKDSFYSPSRLKARKLRKQKIKVQNLIPRAKNIPSGLTEEIKQAIEIDRQEYPLRKAKQEKESLVRYQQAMQFLQEQEGHAILEPQPALPF